MRKFLYMLAVLLVLIGISTNDVEARQDVYATTYLGNSWYVDQDSVNSFEMSPTVLLAWLSTYIKGIKIYIVKFE